MLRKLDEIYFRFRNAWVVFKNPNYLEMLIEDAELVGAAKANGRVWLGLAKHDPYQFENQHFKMGYYYAQEQVRKVI